MKDKAPEAMPFVFFTLSPLGLNLSNEKPVPPPLFCIRLCAVRAFAIPSIESGTGKT